MSLTESEPVETMRQTVSVAGIFRDVTGKPFNANQRVMKRLNRMIATEACHVVTLPIAHLNATQDSVNADFHEAAQKQLGDGADLPAVVKYKTAFYVIDGHHRLVDAAFSGRTLADVRLFDLDGNLQLDFPLVDLMEQRKEEPATDLDGPGF